MNSVSLVGNLATEVELKEVQEKKVASFLLAVGRPGRDAGADFVWITAWERQGELCAEHLDKGARVGIEGRLKSRTWEHEGRRRDAIEIVARRIDFLGGARRDGDGAEVIPFEPAAV
ncbi:MAG: single-stranded DNA-binding protein [Actinomycetota bacterium]